MKGRSMLSRAGCFHRGAWLRAAGHEVRDEDLARVSPLAHAHVIPNGSYFQSPRRRTEAVPQPVMA